MGTQVGPSSVDPDTSDVASLEPWFSRRPQFALVLAGALFAAVLAIRLAVDDPADASVMLFVFPVALVATAFGLRAGVAAGALAVVLTVAWAVARDITISPLGWASRAIPLLLLGGLLGQAADRMRRAAVERRRLETAALLHRRAIEVNDSLVQGMAAAKWSLEAGRVDAGLSTLDDTIARGHELVSDLIREADRGSRSGPDDLT